MNNQLKSILITLGLIIGVFTFIFGLWYITQPKKSSVNLVPFAQCLAEKKVTMYGAYWCSHCKAQKALFGDAFTYVPYVECTEKTELCQAKGIEGFPTWIVPSNSGDKKLPGEQSLETLAKESGCVVPPPEN
ncbi:MAG: thioredoxin domain-containing protein [Candidatus Paceibacterota bacterium]|jgi:hypothetical protein